MSNNLGLQNKRENLSWSSFGSDLAWFTRRNENYRIDSEDFFEIGASEIGANNLENSELNSSLGNPIERGSHRIVEKRLWKKKQNSNHRLFFY